MSKQFSLKELAELTQSKLVGDPTHEIENVDDLIADLDQALKI